MNEEATVKKAAASWKRLMDAQDRMDAGALTVAVAVWASLNADKLLTIAARKAQP